MSTALPVADVADVRAYARRLLHRHPRRIALAVTLYIAAAVSGLVAPRLLGDLVDDVQRGTTTATVDRIALLLAVFVLLQTVLTRWSHWVALVLAERMFAELREEFLERVVDLPLSTVESAGSGDLLTRMTSDIDSLARTVRYAVPEVTVALLTTALTVVAALLAGPQIAVAALVVVPPLWLSTRWYLRRAPAGYLRERATYSQMTGSLTETALGARTVEALNLQERRVARGDADIAASYAAERYTLYLRCWWFPTVDASFVLPVVAVLALGGWLAINGHATLGQVTAVTLYVQQLLDPLDRLLDWLDELQVGASSMARLVGVTEVPDDRAPTDREPVDEQLQAEDVRFAYLPGRDVLHGLDLAVRPGERLAVVGPSGAGKSTISRLLAGIHGPRTGRVELGGVPLLELPLQRLRREVALVT
ncbi:MAG: hypothetical protein QOE84_3256, partial [Actinomycetota bacterium]|nr:hypothetical protein [Actinomycetota bacterium]